MQKPFNFFYAFLLALLGFGVTLMAEDITLTTYYPAPYGAYDELTTTGNVGIGTTSPTYRLDISLPSAAPSLRIQSGGSNVLSLKDTLPLFLFNPPWQYASAGGGSLINFGGGNTIASSPIEFFVINMGNSGGSGTGNLFDVQLAGESRMLVTAGGSVGIGIAPSAKLHVNGNIKAVLTDIDGGSPANMRYNSGTNQIGYDVAELFDASEDVEPGDLLVIDETESVQLRKSLRPYEKTIVGVVSGSPAVLFEGSQLEIAPTPGGFIKGTKPPVALVGRIQCKVTLENGPIERGDFLTSSSMPGHAMKATDRERSFGSIIGKSIEPFDGGPNGEKTGEILILIALQ